MTPPVIRRAAGWAAVGIVVFAPILFLAPRSLPFFEEAWSPRAAGLFLKSALLAGGATAIAVLVGGAVALLIETRRAPFRPALRLVALAPLLLPPYMQVAAWKPLLVDALAGAEALRLALAIFVIGGSWAPLVFFFASQAVRSISGEIIDAARLTEASELKVRASVILPLSAPTIAAGAALVFVLAFLDPEAPALLLVPTYATEIFLQVARGPGAAFATAAPVMVLLLVLMATADGWARRRGFAVTAAEDPRAPVPAERAGAGTFIALAVFFGLLVAFPIVRLIAMVGSPARLADAWALYSGAFLDGIPVIFGTAALATVLAALSVPRSGSPSRAAAVLAWAPIAVPGTVLAAAMIRHYNRPGLDWIYETPLVLVVAGVARFFPIAYHALAAQLRAVPRDLWDAADIEKLSWPARLFRVDLPLAAPGMTLAAAAVAILQAGELAASVLLAPPGRRPVPVVIAAELHYNVDLEVPAALCLLQVALVLAVVAVIAALGGVLAAGRLRARWPS